MKILVTGGIGNIGFVVVKHLLERGYNLRVIDHIPLEALEPDISAGIQNAEYQQVDIRDFQAIKESFVGMDLIVHLAAIPHPIRGQDSEIFEVNAGGTFNVFQAASELGINRIICASSINYLGNGFGNRWIDVKYFPIDEDHPGQATDVYALSKQLMEKIAAYFWQRDEITSACLRFPFVYNPRQFSPDRKNQYLQSTRDSYNQLMALPKEVRVNLSRKLVDMRLQLRQRSMHGEISFPEIMQTLNSMTGGTIMFGRDDFWAYLHVQDAANSIEKAIVAAYEGYQPFYITAPHNVLGLPSQHLAELFYPEVTNWIHEIKGSQTLINCEKAKLILGFEASTDI